MKIAWLSKKLTPNGYIHIDEAISYIAQAIFDNTWYYNDLTEGEPFDLKFITKDETTGTVTRKITRYKLVKSGNSKIPKPYSITEQIGREQFLLERQAYIMYVGAYWKLVDYRHKLKLQVLAPDGHLYAEDKIPEGIWWTHFNRIKYTGYIEIPKGKDKVRGRLLVNKSKVFSYCRHIIAKLKEDEAIDEGKLKIITEKEMQELRNYLKLLVERVQKDETRLVRLTHGKPRILIKAEECNNFLNAISLAHGWDYNKKLHFKIIKEYQAEGSTMPFLKSIGLNQRGSPILVGISASEESRENIARSYIEKIQAEFCKIITAEKMTIY